LINQFSRSNFYPIFVNIFRKGRRDMKKYILEVEKEEEEEEIDDGLNDSEKYLHPEFIFATGNEEKEKAHPPGK
jgi:hypothetical protein